MKLIRDFIIHDFVFYTSASESDENLKHSYGAERLEIHKD